MSNNQLSNNEFQMPNYTSQLRRIELALKEIDFNVLISSQLASIQQDLIDIRQRLDSNSPDVQEIQQKLEQATSSLKNELDQLNHQVPSQLTAMEIAEEQRASNSPLEKG